MGCRKVRSKKGNIGAFKRVLQLLENPKILPHIGLDKDYKRLNKKLEG